MLYSALLFAIFIFFHSSVECSTVPSINEKAIYCSTFGFKSDFSLKILKNVIGTSSEIKYSNEIQLFESEKENDSSTLNPVIALEFDSPHFHISNRNDSDISIIYVHYASVLNDPSSILTNMNRALSSVLAEGQKRSIIICLVIPKNIAASEYQNSILNILGEAWQLLPEKKDIQFAGKFDIQFLTYLIPDESLESFKFEKRSVIDGIVSRQNREYRSIEEVNLPNPSKKVSAASNNLKISTVGKGRIDVAFSASETSVEWARQIANSNLQKLQKPESSKIFKAFMENLVQGASNEINDYISKSGVTSIPSEVVKLANNDMIREIHDMMFPFYKRFVQLAKQDAAKAFNAAVADDIEISIKVMDDLKSLKKKVLNKYKENIKSFTSKFAPHKWILADEMSQFERTLDEYLTTREEQAKLQGILPRSRRPIEFSMYHFLLHPLGRDHRQDPLGMKKSDKLIYNPSLEKYSDLSVDPLTARNIADTPSKKEFAREMLMFPLSIKNPSVPISSKRNKKRSSPPQKDTKRAETGPERFINWKKQPLDRVALGLESANAGKPSLVPAKIIDNVLNTIPYFQYGYYEHPSYNYGPQYSPNNKN